MKSLQEIRLKLAEHKAPLFAKYPIKKLSIFGSFSQKNHEIKNDLDLLVEFNEPIGIQFIDLAEELENLIDYKVDLVSRNGLKEQYYEAIKSDLIDV
ncbi:nucleotidyltransferase domain-containing protein [Gramella sp. AN32]|uniref:Nucleotidyltransferase family protein n=1 Tax=Christiangramia antarctica TaxID=2058158 RepID=A0ABW5X9F3_9FLAO|nr:nucleotidyltransferase domain-containing protein [Gramella sp. AN32]MCM4156092.1 nucleotidyltransferase [Gramella sp. AN32]